MERLCIWEDMSEAIDCWMKSSFIGRWVLLCTGVGSSDGGIDRDSRGVIGGVCGTGFLAGDGGRGTRAAAPGDCGTGKDGPVRLEGERSVGTGGGGMLALPLMVPRPTFSSPSRKRLCFTGLFSETLGWFVWFREFVAASVMTFRPAVFRLAGLTVPKSHRSCSSVLGGGVSSRISSS